MKHTVLDPIGAEVTDLTVADLAPEMVARVRDLLADRGVLVLPGQAIDDTAFVGFLKSFGELTFTKGEAAVPSHPDLNIVSNAGRTTAPRSSFHVDTSYVRHPPAYTALRAVTIPAQGGETLFTNQYRACETLPGAVPADLKGRTITHVVTGLALDDDDETAAEHPVFARHPLSARTALYMSTPTRCAAISGMTAEQSQEAVAFLFEHSTRADNIYRY